MELQKGYKKGEYRFLNMVSKNLEPLDIRDMHTEIRFFYAGCTPCEMRGIMDDLKMAEPSHSIINVFSCSANLADIYSVMEKDGNIASIYYDQDDVFDYGYYLASSEESPVIIHMGDLRGEEDEDR